MATLYASGPTSNDATHWGTTSGDDDGAIPTSADDVIFDAATVDMALDANFSCKSITCSSLTATITQNAGVTVTVAGALAWSSGTFAGGDSAISSGIFSQSGGTFTATSGAWTVTGATWTKSGGTFNHNNGTLCPGNATWLVVTSDGTGAGSTLYNVSTGISNNAFQMGSHLKIEGSFTNAHFKGDTYNLTMVGNFSTFNYSIYLGSGTHTFSGSLVSTNGSANTLLGQTSTVNLTGVGKTLTWWTNATSNAGLNTVVVTGSYSDATLGIYLSGVLTIDPGATWSAKHFAVVTGGAVVNNGTWTAGDNIRIYDGALENATLFTNPPNMSGKFIYIYIGGGGTLTRTLRSQSIFSGAKLDVSVAAVGSAVFNLETASYSASTMTITSPAGTGSVTVNVLGATVTLSSFLNIAASGAFNVVFAIGAGSVTCSAIDYTGVGAGSESITMTSGSLTVSSAGAHAIDIGGGTFTKGTGTVVCAGAGTLTFVAGMAFHNFTWGASKTHNFTAGQTFTSSGVLASNGALGATASVIRSSVDGTHYNWTSSGTSNLADKVDVKDCDASSGSEIEAVGSIGATQNNHNWRFVSSSSGGYKFVGQFENEYKSTLTSPMVG